MMRKQIVSIIVMLLPLFLQWSGTTAQVSHGGKPLPLSAFRNASEKELFVEMPSFDLQETLRMDSLDESDMRSGYHFAYKFMTDYSPHNSGISFTLPDGTKVWRLGIYSPNALSINVLFSKYRVPEGGQLFLYNEDQSRILGAFNHLNNSDLNMLPIAPIDGERIIIEYQEPTNVAFRGELVVGEVNHGYRNLRGKEPSGDISYLKGIPALACFNDAEKDYQKWGRSVVLLVIDGTIGCTGALINNTENDGKPYLLTASHCLNDNFEIKNPDYEKIANSIVCFYNYDSPFCDPITRGTEEMTTASTRFKAVNEKADMALLEISEIPPVYYRPFYAGWNIEPTSPKPYTCIHHPQKSTKRISISNNELETVTFYDPTTTFYEEAHWLVKRWEIGYTHGGSSGSPLFNARGEIIGALTGGQSTHKYPENDYYYKLNKAWSVAEENGNAHKQLKPWLNPSGKEVTTCAGLDPYQASPCYRLSNVQASGKQKKVETAHYSDFDTDFLFGNNPKHITEYAEAYQLPEEATLYGAYFVTPSAGDNYRDMEVEVTVYSGTSEPTTLLYSETFQPSFCNKSSFNDQFFESPKSLDRSQESFIQFKQPVQVSGRFFVGYKLKHMPRGAHFTAYNLPKGETSQNTTWLLDNTKWIPVNMCGHIGFNTSLFIDPVIKYQQAVSNEQIEAAQPVQIQLGSEKGFVHIVLPEGETQATYRLYTAQGMMLENGVISNRLTHLDFKHHTTGVYLLTIQLSGNNYTQKIIF